MFSKTTLAFAVAALAATATADSVREKMEVRAFQAEVRTQFLSCS